MWWHHGLLIIELWTRLNKFYGKIQSHLTITWLWLCNRAEILYQYQLSCNKPKLGFGNDIISWPCLRMAKHSSNQAVGINYIKHTKQAPKQSNFIFEPKYTPFCTMNLITFPSRKKIFKVTETLTKQTKQGKMKNPLHLFPTPQLQKHSV